MRLLDRHATGAFLVIALLIGSACATACGDDEPVRFDDTEAGTRDAAGPSGDELDAATEARGPDTSLDAGLDAGPFDAAVREVSCESSKCAIALTQTAAHSSLNGQGFCALLHDGTVACWGANNEGQLGNGLDAGAPSPNPQRVAGLSNVISIEDTCAIDMDGSAWCWGYGPYLQGSTPGASTYQWTPVKLPIPPATRVVVARLTACALIEGEPQCWGANTDKLIPGATTVGPTPIPMPAGTTVRDIFLADKAAFVLRDDGTLSSWGKRPMLGRETSLFPDPNPDPLSLENVTNVHVASSRGYVNVLPGQNVCAVANGVPYCWGVVTPLPGSTVDETNLNRALPEPAIAPERVVQISSSDIVGSFDAPLPPRWCAVGGSGAVYCWGNNANGQAGDGTTGYAAAAVQVPLPTPAVHVEASADSTCALLVNGKVLCWGGNFYGQLGNGKGKQQVLVPAEVLLP